MRVDEPVCLARARWRLNQIAQAVLQDLAG